MKNILTFIGSFLRLFCLLAIIAFTISLSPLMNLKLNADITASNTTKIQLFYANEHAFDESQSSFSILNAGGNNVTLNIPFYYNSLRLDLSDKEGEYFVKQAYFSFLGYKLPITSQAIIPVNQIKAITEEGGGFKVSTQKDATDPILLIDIGLSKLFILKYILCFVLSLIITFLYSQRKKIIYQKGGVDFIFTQGVRNIKMLLIGNKSIIFPFIVLFITGCLLYIHFITVFSPSIDDEYAALRVEPDVWVGQGRWSIYLITKFIFLYPVIPFLPYILLVASLAFSYIIILRLFSEQITWRAYFVYPIFAFYPTWWCIAEFYANVPAIAIGLSSTVIAVALSAVPLRQKYNKLLSWHDIFAAFLLAFALGTYQSYLLLYAAIYLSWILFGSLNGVIYRDLFRAVVRLVSSSIVSLMVYFIINKLFQNIVPSATNYLDGFVGYDVLFLQPLSFLNALLHSIYSIYFGSSQQFGTNLYLSFAIISMAALYLIGTARAKINFLIYILILLSPFALNVITGGVSLPLRTMISLPFVFWVAAIIMLRSKAAITTFICTLLLSIFQIQMLTTTSQYIVAATLTQQEDRVFASELYNRIQESVNKPIDLIYIDVYGHKPVRTIFPTADTATIQASFYDWDNGNLSRMISYMKMIGYQNLEALSDVSQRKFNNKYFENMPVWPAKGSVSIVNNVVLVKLSSDADPVHAQ